VSKLLPEDSSTSDSINPIQLGRTFFEALSHFMRLSGQRLGSRSSLPNEGISFLVCNVPNNNGHSENPRPGYEMNNFPVQLSCPSSDSGMGPVALRLQLPHAFANDYKFNNIYPAQGIRVFTMWSDGHVRLTHVGVIFSFLIAI
jgi:hypothetical protein